MRIGCSFLLILFVVQCIAQFPHTLVLDVRVGQQRPAIESVVQDARGLIWTGSDLGLIRTDGERIDVMLRSEHSRVTAMDAHGDAVVAAFSDGHIVRCTGLGCDTILSDTLLRAYQVRSMVHSAGDRLLLGTYGAGIWSIRNGKVDRLDGTKGLPDDHVNDLCVLADGRVVAATDQGLALLDGMQVTEVFGQAEGAPDNLVLSVASDGTRIWAGTDRHGPFQWTPGDAMEKIRVPDPSWSMGPVVSIAVQDLYLWMGTSRDGLVLFDTGEQFGGYHQHGLDPRNASVQDVMVDMDGAAWWCTGNERLQRADPAILVVPEHEGLDLRSISALAYDHLDRIWFATSGGLFHHAAAFAEGLTVTKVPLELDQRIPIVSLAGTRNGTMWVATFGAGVYAVHGNGRVEHFTERDGLINDNVLVARARGDTVWFGTLAGISEYRSGGFHDHVPSGSGFVYDLLPTSDKGVLCATDGAGVVRLGGDAPRIRPVQGPRTFYAIIQDDEGGVWASGPGTGICSVTNGVAECIGAERPPFDGNLFAMGMLSGRIVVFGSTGVTAIDPVSGQWSDLTARVGLEDIDAQLNTICTDARGALWLACSMGMIRMRPMASQLDPRIPTVITGMRLGSEEVSVKDGFHTPHDRNDITIHFTGLHYTDPGALRFEVLMAGLDDRSIITRDREMAWSSLPPGAYHFQVRAFTGESPEEEPWEGFRFVVSPPWWELPWVIALTVVFILLAMVFLLRGHDRRIKERERMESERVRFQLEALRSQVDPHFLFNSFNTLVELIGTDQVLAVDHVERLSTFFRNVLLVRDKDLITLDEELRLLDTYFSLERIRFGKAIELRIIVDPAYLERQIVPMSLQMLVENSLKHNTATLSDPVVIEIRVEEDRLVVDNVKRPKLSPPRSTGFGLDSIRKRYASITSKPIEVERGGERFTVRIPLIDPMS